MSRGVRFARSACPLVLMRLGRASAAALWAVVGVLLGTACGAAPPVPAAGQSASPHPARVVLPAAGAEFDYQIGGGYRPAAGVRVVSRDRGDRPAPGRYTVCYVNAFQVQPGELAWWQRLHPDLLLRDGRGRPVLDPDWNEALLDVSTAARRARLAAVVGGWLDGCAAHGFQAVELDNLDSFSRSGGRLTGAQNAAFARLLTGRAHAVGLAVAQKNTAELLPRHRRIGFDFAVVEECGRYDECGAYASAYADRVFVIAYTIRDFRSTCRTWGGRLSVVLRDRDVTPAGRPGHVFAVC